MKAWIRNRFRDAKTSFATVMAIAGILGSLCGLAIILMVVFVPR